MQDDNEKKVFRSFALPLVTFEYLKLFQRQYLAKHQVSINNNQALASLLRQHKQLTEENAAYATNQVKTKHS